MEHGFLKVSASVPVIRVADCKKNADNIIKIITKAREDGSNLLVLPELCVTGCTCEDLLKQQVLLNESFKQCIRIAESVPKDIIVFWGAPFLYNGNVFDCAFVATDRKLKAIIPKKDSDNIFSGSKFSVKDLDINGLSVKFGSDILFTSPEMPNLVVSCLVGSDIYSIDNNLNNYVKSGATIFVALDSRPEVCMCDCISFDTKKDTVPLNESARLCCSCVYSCSGEGESTTDNVYTGHCFISENGNILASCYGNEDCVLSSEPDFEYLQFERRKKGFNILSDSNYCNVPFNISVGETVLSRQYLKNPFVPSDINLRNDLCSNVFRLQTLGLGKRFSHVRAKNMVIGLSGGLDSTLALLVAVNACEQMSISREKIICVTMPCFGTTEKTKNNACILAENLGCTLKTIDISESVSVHFRDIGQDESVYDAAYENSQARERTQVLMDIANRVNGIVVGTGDMSELALGWATFNGDHMSMYDVNSGVPKTLVRASVVWYAQNCENKIISDTLLSIVDTPISPELIPGKQETEDFVGPYELHDFFICHMLKRGASPSKIMRLASYVFKSDYSEAVIYKWLRTFCIRFFAQQFKRNCLPDGPAVLDISLSPRNGFSMPSDTCGSVWIDNLDIYCARTGKEI